MADGRFDSSVVVKGTKNSSEVRESLVEDGDDPTDPIKHKTPAIPKSFSARKK